MQKAVLLIFLFACSYSHAQLQIRNGTLTLAANSGFTLDGLTLTSSERLSFTNTVMNKTTTPVALNNSVYSINKVWLLSSPVAFTGLVRFYYDPAGLNGHSEPALKLSFRSDNVWRPSPNGVVNTSSDYIEETVSAKTFDGLTASAPYAVLPVSLLFYTARLQADGTVQLQWQTSLERANHSFTVQRSSNGSQYESIGKVPASANPAGQGSYRFVDPQPLSGVNVYQLWQKDQNGKEELLGVRVIKTIGEKAATSISPNPASGGELHVALTNAPAKPVAYSIITTSGQLISTGQIHHQYQSIAIGELAAGTYFLQLADGQTLRFQKN